MKQIKTIYWISILVLIIVFAGVFILDKVNDFIGDADASLIVAFVALLISFLSLGLSDKKNKEFKGDVLFWRTNARQHAGFEETFKKCVFLVENNSGFSIKDLRINIRMPNAIHSENLKSGIPSSAYIYSKTYMQFIDCVKFLGINKHDNDLKIEHFLDLEKWNENGIYMTLSGSNIDPTTFRFEHKQKDDLIKSSSQGRLAMTKVK